MTNSKYRIGDFYFAQNEEPSIVDVKRVRKSLDVGMYMSPYNLLIDQGHDPTSIVLQGFLSDYLEGSAGDWGIEKLTGEMAEVGEKIIEIENFDSTNNVRRFYGYPLDYKYTCSGTRPLIFDYLISFICPNPFCYDDTLQYTASSTSVGTTDTSVTLTGLTDGSAPTHPVFIYYNDTGSAITELKISDDASTTVGNVITIADTQGLPNGDTWIIFPTKYDKSFRSYSINAVWEYDGTLTESIDQYVSLEGDNANITKKFTASGRYPEVTSNVEVFQAKATGAANGDLHVQYRACWG